MSNLLFLYIIIIGLAIFLGMAVVYFIVKSMIPGLKPQPPVRIIVRLVLTLILFSMAFWVMLNHSQDNIIITETQSSTVKKNHKTCTLYTTKNQFWNRT